MSITNRSSGSLSTWMPSVLTSTSESSSDSSCTGSLMMVDQEGVESFVIDQGQGRLFTLHTKGEIEMFDVSGTSYISRGKYTRLKNDLISRGIAGAAPNYPQAKVISLAVIGSHESRRACLVAITANGESVSQYCSLHEALAYTFPLHHSTPSAFAVHLPTRSTSLLKHSIPLAPSSESNTIPAHPLLNLNYHVSFLMPVGKQPEGRITRTSNHPHCRNGMSRTTYPVRSGRSSRSRRRILLKALRRF